VYVNAIYCAMVLVDTFVGRSRRTRRRVLSRPSPDERSLATRILLSLSELERAVTFGA
jgi:hypothetical protein